MIRDDRRIIPDVPTACLEKGMAFYTELFGLEVAMDMDWIETLRSLRNQTAQLSLLKAENETTVSSQSPMTIEVEDVDGVHALAIARGYPVVYPLTTESWGVRRFQVRDPNALTINLMAHHG